MLITSAMFGATYVPEPIKHIYLAIDNHVPKGDALLEHPEVNVLFVSASTITGAAILQGMFAEAIQMLAEQGITPPVLLSGNIKEWTNTTADWYRNTKKEFRTFVKLLRPPFSGRLTLSPL